MQRKATANKNMFDNNSHKSIVPYKEEWPRKFESEKQLLQNVFGEEALEIEHIGSTAIPGLSSKDIIDIAVLIDHVDTADAFIDPLEEIGYVRDTERFSAERHFFRKYGETNFHLSIAYKNQGGFWDRQILFRDFLRQHKEYRDEYQKLKEELIKENPAGDDTYIQGKTEFIEKILKYASENEKL